MEPVLRIAVCQHETSVEMDGTLKDIVIATCAGINALYNALEDDESQTLFRGFIARAVFDPGSPVWDRREDDEVARKEGYTMTAESVAILNEVMSAIQKREEEKSGTDRAD